MAAQSSAVSADPQGLCGLLMISSFDAGVISRALDSAVQSLNALSDLEWDVVAQGLADLLFTLTLQMAAPVCDGGSSTKAAIMNRVYQTIERRLEDPDLTPARVAQSEGISERYLQKLFEGVSDNFSHYVRERRLQRAWADLANPAEGHRTISEIAYRYGFGDLWLVHQHQQCFDHRHAADQQPDSSIQFQ